MAKQYQGISALTVGSTPQIAPLVVSSKEIPSVRVKDIILDDTHPKFEEYGGWNGIGTIFYDDVLFPFASETANVAIPFYSNHKFYPLINEIVPLLFLTSWDAQSNTNINQAYYLPSINIWNSQHHNALPDPTLQPSNQSQRDYQNSIDGSERDVRRVYDNSTDINLGVGFNEQINTHPLRVFAGDNVLEGRWGNTIRLGSTIQNSINYPITIIRNGQTPNASEEGWVPIVEDINNDKSLIYLTDNQKIDINVASQNYASYTSAPVAPREYTQNQIILNSGRLLFNSKTSDILLSSNQSISLNAVNSVNIDTKNVVVNSNFYLGGPNVTEPLLRGQATIDQLNALIDTLITFFNAYGGEAPNAKIASTPLAKASVIPSLNRVKANLELTKSKIGFIK
jgi:hypothetical protein